MKLVVTLKFFGSRVVGFDYESKEALDSMLRYRCECIRTYKMAIHAYNKEVSDMMALGASCGYRNMTKEELSRIDYIESEVALLNELCYAEYNITSQCGRYTMSLNDGAIGVDYSYVAPIIQTVEEYLIMLFKEEPCTD